VDTPDGARAWKAPLTEDLTAFLLTLRAKE